VQAKLLHMLQKFFPKGNQEQCSTVTGQSSGLHQFTAGAAKAVLASGVRTVDLTTACSPKGGDTCN
jgi:hypothetical protein